MSRTPALIDLDAAAANRRRLAAERREELGRALWRGVPVGKADVGGVHKPTEKAEETA